MLRSIDKHSGESVESVLKKKTKTMMGKICRKGRCGDAFPIEGVLVATYVLSVEALPHCRCRVANKSYMV